jgi:GH24 family phage-related lysozyme (muramidase)
MVLKTDPEYGKPIGTKVTMERIDEVFEKDLDSVETDCKRLYPDFHDFPEEAQLCIGNMMFNLGLPRLRNFKNMEKQVNARNWSAAGDEAMDSRWFKQVPARAARIVKRLKSIK